MVLVRISNCNCIYACSSSSRRHGWARTVVVLVVDGARDNGPNDVVGRQQHGGGATVTVVFLILSFFAWLLPESGPSESAGQSAAPPHKGNPRRGR